MKKRRVTRAEYDEYCDAVAYWMAALLPDWRYYYDWKVEDEDSIALVYKDDANSVATFGFCRTVNFTLTSDDIQRTAFHEVLHCVLAELQVMIDRHYTREHYLPALERTIHRLEQVLAL